jgi:hypothetical protein
MTDSKWRVLPQGTIAEYLDESEFRGILQKTFAVPPDHLGVLIRDGQLVDAFDGGHFSVGGVWETLKSALGGKHAFRFLIADTKPFRHEALLTAATKDHQEVTGHLTLELQIDGRKPADVLGLLEGRSTLTPGHVYDRLAAHLQTRVIERELGSHDASELRGNSGLQDRLQAELSSEVARLAGDLGLTLRSATISWAQTDEEEQALRHRRVALAEQDAAFEHEVAMNALKRERAATTFAMQAELQEDAARADAETELQMLLQSNKLKLRDARNDAERAEELRELGHQAEVARKKRIEARQAQLDAATTDVERRKLELEIKRMDSDFELERRRQEMDLKQLDAKHARDNQLGDLDVAGDAWELQKRKLEGMQQLQLDKDREKHALDSDRQRQDHEAQIAKMQQEQYGELEKLKLQSQMTPDQLLAVQAGLSPEVAKVFAARAGAEGTHAQEKEAILREMVDLAKQGGADSADRIQAVVNTAFDRFAPGTKAAPAGAASPTGQPAANAETTECPSCHHKAPVADRFCKVCGHQLRS